jgi:hypothetical protein
MNALHLTNAEFRSLAARVTDIAADLLAGLDDLRAFPPVRGEPSSAPCASGTGRASRVPRVIS